MEYKVGKKLWLVVTNRWPIFPVGKEIEITRVGRKYAYFVDHPWESKIDMEEDTTEGGSKVYESESDYKYQIEKLEKWKELKRKFDNLYYPPKSINLSDINMVMEKLFGEKP